MKEQKRLIHGSRRGNHEIMMRGTFKHRIKNEIILEQKEEQPNVMMIMK